MINPENLSPFAKTALSLDAEFSRFDKLSRELEHVDINSDKGLTRAQVIIPEINSCRERMAVSMQQFSQELNNSRVKCDDAEKIATSRTIEVEMRKRESDKMLQRFQSLGEMVQNVSASLAELRPDESTPGSEEGRAVLLRHFPEVTQKIDALIDEVKKLVEESKNTNMEWLEKNADSLRKNLQAVRNRLNLAAQN